MTLFCNIAKINKITLNGAKKFQCNMGMKKFYFVPLFLGQNCPNGTKNKMLFIVPQSCHHFLFNMYVLEIHAKCYSKCNGVILYNKSSI